MSGLKETVIESADELKAAGFTDDQVSTILAVIVAMVTAMGDDDNAN